MCGDLIAFRKAHPVLAQEKELLGMDQLSCGVPDVSYHGTYVWQTPSEVSSRQLGVYYCGKMAGDADCFVAYNMHWLDHSFAPPGAAEGEEVVPGSGHEGGDPQREELLDDQRGSVPLRADDRCLCGEIGGWIPFG